MLHMRAGHLIGHGQHCPSWIGVRGDRSADSVRGVRSVRGSDSVRGPAASARPIVAVL
jgi:hypothetical protein